MSANPQSEAMITSSSYKKGDDEFIKMHLNKSCHAELTCSVDKELGSEVHLTLNKGTAQEVLVHLHTLFAHDYTFGEEGELLTVNTRLTKEQFQWMARKAATQDVTHEYYIRQLIRAEINRQRRMNSNRTVHSLINSPLMLIPLSFLGLAMLLLASKIDDIFLQYFQGVFDWKDFHLLQGLLLLGSISIFFYISLWCIYHLVKN